MSKMSKAVSQQREEASLRLDETVVNFMGGDSYVINPLDTLKMISASSIMGEPSYYRDSTFGRKYIPHHLVEDYLVTSDKYVGKSTNEIFEEAIDDALSYDFAGTLHWAAELRIKFNMRLNPQIIMVRAAIHPKRAEFTSKYPGMFDTYAQGIMSRPDEPLSQMTYYMYKNKGAKNKIPSILKRSWAKKMSNLSAYEVAKYRNHEIGMINGVRICHANSKVIDELMQTGKVDVQTNSKTWENLRSEGKSWKEIFHTIKMGHMALLRNLRGVFTETEDVEFCQEYLTALKKSVKSGKQFPFRYYNAIEAVSRSDCHHKPQILEALEECMDLAIDNLPKLKGKTMCLSDNSGSAWHAFNSEYGSSQIAVIDNLSSVLTASLSEEGYVGRFGDELNVTPIVKRRGLLNQTQQLNARKGKDVGLNTEGGIWEFFKAAINKKVHWDNIFIYSDQQAGHGGLYGTTEQRKQYAEKGYAISRGNYINVFKLVQEYRKKVNPKVNVFTIQTAGYNNALLPEYAYRTSILYGWTGKESLFASELIRQWDELDEKNKK